MFTPHNPRTTDPELWVRASHLINFTGLSAPVSQSLRASVIRFPMIRDKWCRAQGPPPRRQEALDQETS